MFSLPKFFQPRTLLKKRVAKIIGRRLHSDDGDAGLERFQQQISTKLATLEQAWNVWLEERDATALDACLEHCAYSVEERSLRAVDYPLRVGLDNDIYVRTSILWVVLECLSGENVDKILDYAKVVFTENSQLAPFGFGYTMGMLLARVQLENEHFVEAEATSRRLENICYSPYAQHMLYSAMVRQKRKDAGDSVSDVVIDDLSDRFCAHPFTTLATGPTGFGRGPETPEVFACECPGILPFPVSDRSTSQTAEEIWNGSAIQEIRRSILDGDFKYCSRMGCSRIVTKVNLPRKSDVSDPLLRSIIDGRKTFLENSPSYFSLSHDPSCNLACPSCRLEILSINNAGREKLDEFSERIMLPLLQRGPAKLFLSRDGDPFASKHYRRLLRALQPERYPQLKLEILTNGILLTEREWESLPNIHKMVESITVSIDGAEARTYEDLRRPGKWKTLCENMEFLGGLRREGKLPHLAVYFVIQKKNYREIPGIIELGKQWAVDSVGFFKLFNVGSYSSNEFLENDICDERHPEHDDFLEVLRNPIVEEEHVVFYTAKQFLEKARRTKGRERISRVPLLEKWPVNFSL